MLIAVHIAYFLWLHFQDFHRRVPGSNWTQFPLAIPVLLVILLQFSAFVKTWKPNNNQCKSAIFIYSVAQDFFSLILQKSSTELTDIYASNYSGSIDKNGSRQPDSAKA